jgi:hypothetical protein
VKGSADRPGDAGRDPGPRPGREPESAAFEVVRVGGRAPGRWSRAAAFGFAVVLVGMVAVAIGSRSSTDPSVAAAATPTADVASTLGSRPRGPNPASPEASARFNPVRFPPVETSDPASTKIRLTAQRDATAVSVHGDVYVAKVTWVFVALKDSTGQVVRWASVSVPGAAGPSLDGGPTLRFDVDLGVPDGSTGTLTVQAIAYDGTGRVVGSTLLPIREAGAP